MFHHRPLEEKDIPTICELPQNADELFYMFPRATYPLTASQLSEALETRHDSTVIEMDGEVVGFANFSQCKFRGRCSLGNVIIAPKARSKGVGRYMITSMMGIAFDKHEATELIASCYNHNVPGLLFYPRMGFRPYAIEEKRDRCPGGADPSAFVWLGTVSFSCGGTHGHYCIGPGVPFIFTPFFKRLDNSIWLFFQITPSRQSTVRQYLCCFLV